MKATGGTECKITNGSRKMPNTYSITNMPYALCSRARCLLLPSKKLAVCVCDLENYHNQWQSLSISPKNYQKSKPAYNKKGELKTVQSNYSMANITDFSQPLNVTCDYKTPHFWANCYGVRCLVLRQGKGSVKNAVSCACPVSSATSFMIGSPSVSYCGPENGGSQDGKIWSATKGIGTVQGLNPATFIYKTLFPTSPPGAIKAGTKSKN